MKQHQKWCSEFIREFGRKEVYPADIFLERTSGEWKKFHAVLDAAGLCGDGYLGCWARMVREQMLEDMLVALEEKEET